MTTVSRKFSGLHKALILTATLTITACTQNATTADTALLPQATASTPAQTASGASASSQTALAADASQTPAQTVTEAQLQTPSAGLASGSAGQTIEQPKVAALDTSNAVTFLPVEGAPQSAVTRLSKSLRASAQEDGLALLAPTQPGAKYRVKGYFSALNDGSSTLLVYVWDVLDTNGKRVHRINGQERSSSSNANPWLAVSEEEIERVADRTTSRLKSWVNSKKG